MVEEGGPFANPQAKLFAEYMALITRITNAIILAHAFLLRIYIPEIKKIIFITLSLVYAPNL